MIVAENIDTYLIMTNNTYMRNYFKHLFFKKYIKIIAEDLNTKKDYKFLNLLRKCIDEKEFNRFIRNIKGYLKKNKISINSENFIDAFFSSEDYEYFFDEAKFNNLINGLNVNEIIDICNIDDIHDTEQRFKNMMVLSKWKRL